MTARSRAVMGHRLAGAPFAVVGVLTAAITLLFHHDLILVMVGTIAFNLLPLFLHGFASWNRSRRPVPGFRSIPRAAIKGAVLGLAAPFAAYLTVFPVLLILRIGFMDEASLGESSLSVTALGLPIGFLSWFLPQTCLPTAFCAAVLLSGCYSLAAVDYRRRLRRIQSTSSAGASPFRPGSR